MTATPRESKDADTAAEARALAEEALEARQQGDRAEATFLAREATELDSAAAAEVLKQPDPNPAKKEK